MKKKRIVVSVINNIAFDQRVEKTCNTLFKGGYEVLLIGTQLHDTPPLDRPYPTTRFPLWFSRSVFLYVEFNMRLFFQLLFKTRKKDILWANDLDALLPNYLVSRLKGQKLIYDSHELFSELPSVQGRPSQKVWRWLEKKLIHKPNAVITVSDSIADWYADQYKMNRPSVVKNLPEQKNIPWNNHPDPFLLYQGVLNPGRGLLSMIQSLTFVPENISLKIAGDGPFRNEVEHCISQNQLHHRVQLLGKLDPNDLALLTPKALMGLSLEEDLGLSYRYSLPNKLFDYIQAKIPIVGTYLPEIQHTINTYQIGEIIANHDPEEVARQIQIVLQNGKEHYQKGLEKASKELVWEHQESTLLNLVSKLS